MPTWSSRSRSAVCYTWQRRGLRPMSCSRAAACQARFWCKRRCEKLPVLEAMVSYGRRRGMDDTGQSCAECLSPVDITIHAQNGASLCPQCAEQFYCTCAGCGGLIPQDEAVVRDGALCCAQCFTAPVSKDDAAALSDEALAALVAEFIRLHAEAKHLNDRLEAVKEQLKRHAASQPRMANAVLLRSGEYAVKCGYSVRVSYKEAIGT